MGAAGSFLSPFSSVQARLAWVSLDAPDVGRYVTIDVPVPRAYHSEELMVLTSDSARTPAALRGVSSEGRSVSRRPAMRDREADSESTFFDDGEEPVAAGNNFFPRGSCPPGRDRLATFAAGSSIAVDFGRRRQRNPGNDGVTERGRPWPTRTGF